MCFFALNMLCTSCVDMVSEDMGAVLWILYYVYIILLAFTLVKNSGKVASTVLSGSPSLSLGDITHQAHGMMHSARAASHSMGKLSQGISKGAQTMGSAAVDGKATLDGMRSARQGAMDAAKVSDATRVAAGGAPMTEKQLKGIGRQAAAAQLKDTLKQRFQDGIFKHGTGQNVVRTKNDGHALTLGQQFFDERGTLQTATIEDVKKSHQDRANNISGQTSQLLKDGFDEHDDLVNKGILPANEAFDFLDDLGFK